MALILYVALALAAPPREIASHPDAHVQRPQFSPDGSKLAYEANDHQALRVEQYVGDVATGRFTRVLPNARGPSALTQGFATRTADAAVVHELSFSPAALGRFVVASSAAAGDSDLYFDTGAVAVASPAPDGGPAWSPDGLRIAFTSSRSGEGDLYVADLTALNAAPRQLTALMGSSEVFATWTPDGRGIAYVAHGRTGDNLWMLADLAGAPRQLTRWPGVQTRPSFSPDGRYVAFYANHEDDARFDLYVMQPMHLAEPVMLVPDVVMNSQGPAWTPDGRHLLVVVDEDAFFDPIVAVPVGDRFAALPIDLGTVGNGDLDVARGPDGVTRIAWAAQGLTGDTTRTFKRLYVAELPALP
jgi:Tol biopolymer transport system component